MKKNNSFISNPITLSTFIIFAFSAFVLLLLIILLNVDILLTNIFLQIVSILLFGIICFFLILAGKFSYRIEFDMDFIYQRKCGKLVNQFKIDETEMLFISPKYGYVNIEGKNIEGKKVILSFEFSKKRGKTIEKYYKKPIKNIPEKYIK